MTRSAGMCALLLSIARAAGGSGLDAPPSPGPPDPSASPSPAPSPTARLRLDVDAQVQRVLEAEQALPHFSESVEVVGKSPQVMLERILRGIDLDCGPASVGAPTEAETRAVRPHPAPYLDFLALARAVAGKHRDEGNPRYFIYRVRRGSEVGYVLREERIPDGRLYNTPGTSFELVDSFPDLEPAIQAMRRLERGMGAKPSPSAYPLPPWATSPCRLREK